MRDITDLQETFKLYSELPDVSQTVSFADLEGAMPLGMKVAWINRGQEPLGRFTPKPLYEFSDLSGVTALFE